MSITRDLNSLLLVVRCVGGDGGVSNCSSGSRFSELSTGMRQRAGEWARRQDVSAPPGSWRAEAAKGRKSVPGKEVAPPEAREWR